MAWRDGRRSRADLTDSLCGRAEAHEGGRLRPVRGPDVLRVEDVPMPSPAAGQVLVKVAATSINLSDWEGLRGSPCYARLGGLRAPRRPMLGSDIAGLGRGGRRGRHSVPAR